MGQRCPKQGHDAITHHLVHRAFVLVDGRHHAVEHRIEQVPCLLGVTVGQEFHGPFQVGKQYGHLFPLPFQRTAGGENFFRQIGRGIGEGSRRGCPGWRWGRRRGHLRRTGPDEDPAFLIHRQALAVDEFVFEVIQRGVVQVKLPLERAIGHPAPLAQERNHLIQDR